MEKPIEAPSHITVLLKKYDPDHPSLPGQIVGIFCDHHEIRCQAISFEVRANAMGKIVLEVPMRYLEIKMQD